MRALVLDGLAAAAAGVAPHLHLLEHSGGELLLDDAHATAAAGVARLDLAVGAAGALAVLADVLLVPLELGRGAVVEVAEGDLDPYLDVVAAGLTAAAAEVSVAAEEAAEEVKGIMATAAAAAAAVLVLLDGLVAVAVVDLAGFGVAQNLIGFRDLDELVVRSVIAAGEEKLARQGWCWRDVLEGHTGSCLGGTSWRAGGMRILIPCLKPSYRHQESVILSVSCHGESWEMGRETDLVVVLGAKSQLDKGQEDEDESSVEQHCAPVCPKNGT